MIGDDTEEPLAGYDIKLTGQVPYLPWASIKATRYFWDKTNAAESSSIKGTILGVAIRLTPSIEVELGTETSNTADRASHLRLTTQLPFKDNESLTNFSLDSTPFRNTGIVNLTDLSLVERSNKIRIEKVTNGQHVLGVYNATTTGARCILYNASGVAVADGSGTTTDKGTVDLSNIKLPTTRSLYFSTCTGGSYTDEATGLMVNPAPTLHGAMMYSGTGHLTIIASPLSEIAYQLAGGVGGAGADLTQAIDYQNKVATAFGLDGIDIITTIPTDLNDDIARNDDSGKFGLVLAGVSQVGENSGESPMETIEHLVNDMNGTDGSNVDTIEGRLAFSETVDMLTAIDNFKASGGDNNLDNGEGSGHTGAAGSAIGQGSVSGNLSILKISLYEGISGTEPTLQDYTNAGISGVNAGNLTQVNARLATATTDDSDTTTKIQDLVNTTSGVANHDNSTLSASPASVPADGTTFATITLQAKDFNGDDLTTGGLSVSLTHNGSSGVNIPALMTDNNNGTYSATISNTTAELVILSAAFGNNTVASTATITFTGAATTANSTLSASPASVPADGTTFATITLQAIDSNGNDLTTGGLTVNMTSASSSVNIYSVMIDNGDGTYSATITSTTTADTLVISADFGGNPVANTVYVTFTGAATAANSTLSASPTSVPADSSTIVTITLQAKDANGHNLTTGGLTVNMTRINSNGVNIYSVMIDNGDGTYRATMTNTVVEDVTISADFGGHPVANTATVTFTGAATAANSTLSASPTSVTTDGVTTIILQAKDFNGVNLTTGGLNVSITSTSSTATLSSVTDHHDGSYSATISNTTAEMVTISAEFGGNPVASTVDVTFISPPMVADGLTYRSVIIGTQTWTAENMRYETANSSSFSYDDNVNNDANGYGKLYDWKTAVNGVQNTPEGAQGICANGWHIPSDNDWKILEGHLGMSEAEQDNLGLRGTDQGAQLKVGGSGFEGVLAGFYDSNISTNSPFLSNFTGRDSTVHFWSSTSVPNPMVNPLGFLGSDVYVRSLSSGDTKVRRSLYDKSVAIKLSVRCLKD